MLRVRATARLALGLVWCLSVTTVSAQADEARARKIVSGSCFVCHGAEGESGSEAFPRLAGQHWEYTAKQLDNFKSGKRKSTAMATMAARLSSDEMQALGRYFEKMSVPPEPVTQPELVAKGRVLYHQGNTQSDVPACASCHGPAALGTATLPRLAGQYAAYIETQLQQFSKRERTNDNAVMHTIVSKMTGPEMAAVAQYLASK
jgi:cytochrome c553